LAAVARVCAGLGRRAARRCRRAAEPLEHTAGERPVTR
jgi:hypothetical protein